MNDRLRYHPNTDILYHHDVLVGLLAVTTNTNEKIDVRDNKDTDKENEEWLKRQRKLHGDNNFL
jgi:hypothetical protein